MFMSSTYVGGAFGSRLNDATHGVGCLGGPALDLAVKLVVRKRSPIAPDRRAGSSPLVGRLADHTYSAVRKEDQG